MNEAALRAVGTVCVGCVSYLGLDFRLAPALIGIAAAFLVRVPLYKPKARFLAEASFTSLGMIATFVTIVDHQLGPGPAFWAGIGFGACASSMLEIGKSAMGSALQGRMQAAFKALLGLKAE